MEYQSRTRRPRARFWIAGGLLIGLSALRLVDYVTDSPARDWSAYAGVVGLGILGVSIIVGALLRPFDEIAIIWEPNRVSVTIDGSVRFDGTPNDISEVIEDGLGFYLWAHGHKRSVRILKRTLNEFVVTFLRMKAEKNKKGEPGATDNPDDAQRLREDH